MRKAILAVLAFIWAVPSHADTFTFIPRFGAGTVQEYIQFHDHTHGFISAGQEYNAYPAALTIDIAGRHRGFQLSGEFFRAQRARTFDWSTSAHRSFHEWPISNRGLSLSMLGYVRPIRWLSAGAGFSVLNVRKTEAVNVAVTDHEGMVLGYTPVTDRSYLTYIGPEVAVGLMPRIGRVRLDGLVRWQPAAVRVSRYRTDIPEFGQSVTVKTWDVASGITLSSALSYRVDRHVILFAGAGYRRVRTEDGADFLPGLPHFLISRTVSFGTAFSL